MKVVYLSLSISNCPLHEAQNKALHYKERLEKKGYEVVTPFDCNPDLSKPYSYLMGKDIEALLECEAVFFCPGWTQSKGCRAEFAIAQIYEKKIIEGIYETVD